ncbi:dihydroxyacetone phosphate acyltransferase-like, partial [Limulus polyphemus]|uniref:Dihydroxyacetone phosphate acyltransferase-like n=1 Tax=Limulus polyphemus TaxID=6850 RepID=A0ABM1BQB4_LIMPO
MYKDMASTSTRIIGGKTFMEILEERRKDGDFLWVTRSFQTPKYQYNRRRVPAEITQEVMNSARVQAAIKKVTIESNRTRQEVEADVNTILNEMTHNFQLGSVRLFGYMLSKVFKQLYTGLYVNLDGVEK